jgi:hypothetical protein
MLLMVDYFRFARRPPAIGIQKHPPATVLPCTFVNQFRKSSQGGHQYPAVHGRCHCKARAIARSNFGLDRTQRVETSWSIRQILLWRA